MNNNPLRKINKPLSTACDGRRTQGTTEFCDGIHDNVWTAGDRCVAMEVGVTGLRRGVIGVWGLSWEWGKCHSCTTADDRIFMISIVPFSKHAAIQWWVSDTITSFLRFAWLTTATDVPHWYQHTLVFHLPVRSISNLSVSIFQLPMKMKGVISKIKVNTQGPIFCNILSVTIKNTMSCSVKIFK